MISSKKASRRVWTCPFPGHRRQGWPPGPLARLDRLAIAGQLNIGAIPTCLEPFGRYVVGLTPRALLIAADTAGREGNLYTCPNTEVTPAIVEATAFKSGSVFAQVNRIVDKLPRVDVPAGPVILSCSRQHLITWMNGT